MFDVHLFDVHLSPSGAKNNFALMGFIPLVPRACPAPREGASPELKLFPDH